MKTVFRMIWGWCLVTIFILPAFAQKHEISPESLVFGEEDFVVTAMKYEQKINESPSTITVVTEEDIRLSGAINITDVLRMVEGLDIAAVTSTDLSLSARGFNLPPGDKMLVMIDGRSIYYELMGFVLWDTLPIVLEEIKRVEVVKGPGSVLYGANAYSGVINIITKKPKEAEGTQLFFTAGEYGTCRSSLIHADVIGKFSYKISGGWDQVNQWQEKDELEGKSARANIVTSYKFDERCRLDVTGGYSRSYEGKIMSSIEVGPQERDCPIPYIDVKYDFSDWQFRTWWRGCPKNTETKILKTGQEYKWPADTYNVELQRSLKIGRKHRLISGLEGRYYKIGKGGMFEEKNKQELGAFFIQDEFTPGKRVKLVFGGRYDYNSEIGTKITPRGSLIYFLDDNQQIRLSGTTAFRNPSFMNIYLYQDAVYPCMIYDPVAPPTAFFTVSSRGNADLRPEKVTTFEMGYKRKINNNIKGKVDLFYNKYKDFINGGLIGLYEMNELYPGSPAYTFPKYWSFFNAGEVDSYGGEAGIDFKFTSWLKGLVNYSYQNITYTEDLAVTLEDDKGERLRVSPEHKVNAGLRAILKNGISANIIAHYVSERDYTQELFKQESKLDPYTLVNCRVGYRFFRDSMEVAVSVYNLLEDKHYEYPRRDPDTFFPMGEEIGRRFGASLSYKF